MSQFQFLGFIFISRISFIDIVAFHLGQAKTTMQIEILNQVVTEI